MDSEPHETVEQLVEITLEDGTVLMWSLNFSALGTLCIDMNRINRKLPWTRLPFCQCLCCPLEGDDEVTCPVADVVLEYAIDVGDHASTEMVQVRVCRRDGTEVFSDTMPLQDAVGELIRLAVYQSGCPVGRRIKPAMAQLGLFPKEEEVLEALARHFVETGGFTAAAGAMRCMSDLNELFRSLGKRLNAAASGDVYLNAVVVQDAVSALFRITAPQLIRRVAFSDHSRKS